MSIRRIPFNTNQAEARAGAGEAVVGAAKHTYVVGTQTVTIWTCEALRSVGLIAVKAVRAWSASCASVVDQECIGVAGQTGRRVG